VKDDERRKKKNNPEGYIDLFADDDEEEEASVGSLFSDDDEDEEAAEEEDLAAEDEETEEDGADGEEEPAHTEYGMPLPTDEEASYVEPEEKFDRTGNASKESFAFDRFGRRTGKVPRKKRPKERYGKRKHAKKATTTLLLNETEALREREEARKRASERDKLRQKQRRLEMEQRRAQRRVERKKRLYAILVLLGLFVLLLLAGYFTFLIRSIDVVGTLTRYTKEELITASGLKLQKHILLQDLDEAQEKLRRDPYLNATVKYVFPNRIRITLEERGRAGAVAWGPNKEYIAIIDRAGIVLESDASSYTGLPLVQGSSSPAPTGAAASAIRRTSRSRACWTCSPPWRSWAFPTRSRPWTSPRPWASASTPPRVTASRWGTPRTCSPS
jgi:cell division septal protein FtsQ